MQILLKITALTPIVHGDAGINSVGANNTRLFNRQLQYLNSSGSGSKSVNLEESLVEICNSFSMTESPFKLLESLSTPDLLASFFTAQFPICYPGDGCGLFTGIERYRFLSTRLADGCQCTFSLADLWHRTANKLGLEMVDASRFSRLLLFFQLPKPVQQLVISSISQRLELIIMTSRFIAESIKLSNSNYAEKAEKELKDVAQYTPTSSQLKTLDTEKPEDRIISIPAISGNMLRHCMLREPLAIQLLKFSGVHISIETERFLFGGGQLAAKGKAPSSADLIEAQIRDLYPSVDLLGGSMDSFILSRSRATIRSWIVCAENNFATEKIGNISSNLSIFDAISETTQTRSGIGKEKDSGQMIYSFEELAVGTAILVQINLLPFTRTVVHSCAIAGINQWAKNPVIGGKSAIGKGHFGIEYIQQDIDESEYMQHLADRREDIAIGLSNGNFRPTLLAPKSPTNTPNIPQLAQPVSDAKI